MRYIAFARPGDDKAQKVFDAYFKHRNLSEVARRLRLSFVASLKKWMERPAFIVCTVMLATCMLATGLWAFLLAVVGVTSFAYVLVAESERPIRRYERQVRRDSILVVPKFMVDACAQEADRHGNLTDWEEYESRRFALFETVMHEADYWLQELERACECRNACGHTNRLTRTTRDKLRRRVRALIRREVVDMASEHRLALEANKAKNAAIRDMLRATSDDEENG